MCVPCVAVALFSKILRKSHLHQSNPLNQNPHQFLKESLTEQRIEIDCEALFPPPKSLSQQPQTMFMENEHQRKERKED